MSDLHPPRLSSLSVRHADTWKSQLSPSDLRQELRFMTWPRLISILTPWQRKERSPLFTQWSNWRGHRTLFFRSPCPNAHLFFFSLWITLFWNTTDKCSKLSSEPSNGKGRFLWGSTLSHQQPGHSITIRRPIAYPGPRYPSCVLRFTQTLQIGV